MLPPFLRSQSWNILITCAHTQTNFSLISHSCRFLFQTEPQRSFRPSFAFTIVPRIASISNVCSPSRPVAQSDPSVPPVCLSPLCSYSVMLSTTALASRSPSSTSCQLRHFPILILRALCTPNRSLPFSFDLAHMLPPYYSALTLPTTFLSCFSVLPLFCFLCCSTCVLLSHHKADMLPTFLW
jgi:hypothetical protein